MGERFPADMSNQAFEVNSHSHSGQWPWHAFVGMPPAVVATSDGPDGNVGFPWQDEEIAVFEGILRTAADGLSEEEILELGDSLRAFREKKDGE